MNTDNEKNISVILKQDEDKDEKIVISFGSIFCQLKRALSLWLVLSIIMGLVVASGVFFLDKTTKTDKITSLVSFNYSGIQSGLAPDGTKFDVNKIKAPNIIESALTELGEPLSIMEDIRRNIKIDGVIPAEALDKIMLYHDVYSSGNSSGLAAAEALLNIDYNSTYYIIEFDNATAGIDLDTGKKIINSVLNAYQDYFFKTYGYNEALGNSVVAVDYTEYDYPAAVDVFKGIYDELDRYITRLQQNDSINATSFRSNETGYSFADIRRSINVLRTADLDALSSYITINNVTNDKEQLLTYYEFLIEEFEREEKVLESELNSISKSIDSYEKDQLLIFGEASDMDTINYSQASEKYDQLIEERISVQERYSAKKQEIEYYKVRFKTFKNNTNQNNADLEYVDEGFAKLYEKTKELIDTTTKTSDEYYENVVFANAYNILVPATGNTTELQLGGAVMPILIVEAVIFVVYIGWAFISAIVMDMKKNKNTKEETTA